MSYQLRATSTGFDKTVSARTEVSGNAAGNRGMALLMTLSILTLLIVTAVELNRRSRDAVVATAIQRDRMTLSYMASSGVHVGMAMLVRDKMDTEFDSIQEDWANPERVNEVLQDFPFEEGKLQVAIQDELGKVQVNALIKFPEGREFNEPQRIIWDRILRFLINEDEVRDDDTSPAAIINSVKDWLDSNDDDAITGLTGAESPYYQGLDIPYACRNGPIAHISEMLLIKGVTEDLMSASTPETGSFASYLTVHGMETNDSNKFTYPGRINLNTAEIPVLAAILPMGQEMLAIELDAYRREMSEDKYVHDLKSPAWYKNVMGAADVEINKNLVATGSDIFRIASTAVINETSLAVNAVVRREKDKKTGKWVCVVLNWLEE